MKDWGWKGGSLEGVDGFSGWKLERVEERVKEWRGGRMEG